MDFYGRFLSIYYLDRLPPAKELVMRTEEDIYRNNVSLLSTLMMLDYIITYIGINKLRVVEEANPFNIWLFEIPFIHGFTVRLVYVGIIAWLSIFIFKAGYKYRHEFIKFALILNIIVALIHLRWILIFLILYV